MLAMVRVKHPPAALAGETKPALPTAEDDREISLLTAPLQFAVTREDPRTESGVLDDWSARAGRRDPRVLLIASGGCTPLALQARWPDATICLVDPNPAQLDHVRQKILARDAGETSRLISGGPGSLLERGNFEGLFRVLRGVLHDFVAPPEAWERLISGDMARLSDLLESPWWVTAFDVAFSDALLLRMFGDEFLHARKSLLQPRHFGVDMGEAFGSDEVAVRAYRALGNVLEGFALGVLQKGDAHGRSLEDGASFIQDASGGRAPEASRRASGPTTRADWARERDHRRGCAGRACRSADEGRPPPRSILECHAFSGLRSWHRLLAVKTREGRYGS